MPAIRQINTGNNSLSFTDATGNTYQFNSLNVPPNAVTPSAVENYITSTVQAQAINPSYQFQVHVFTVLPLTLTAYIANIGEQIPLNWWLTPVDTQGASI